MQAIEPHTGTRPSTAGLPRGPKASLFTTLHFLRDPYGFFDHQLQRYGDPCTLFTEQGPLVITATPELVRTVFSADPETVGAWGVDLLGAFLGETSVLMSSGDRHRRDRKLLNPPFNGARMRAYGRIIMESALEATRSWNAGWQGPAQTVTTAISLDVIVRAIFGIEETASRQRARDVVASDVRAMTPSILFLPPLRRRFLGLGPWAKHVQSRGALDALLYAEIAARRATEASGGARGEDILSLTVGARYDDGTSMTDAEIRDQLITLLAAGHETTATSLAWALYWTHRDPAIAAALRAELAALGANPEPDAIASLPLLDAVCSETLRLHPIVTDVARRLRAPMTFGAYELPARTGVAVIIGSLHANPALYPDPGAFDAKRFLGAKPSPFAYAPFGGGSRRCLGAAFAMYEMKLVLATLLAHFDLELLDRDVRPARRNITMGPKGGVRMRVTGRRT
jgi:cytochrome P450